MKKILSVLLVAVILMGIGSSFVLAEEAPEEFMVTLKSFKILEESSPNMGNEWFKCVSVHEQDKDNPTFLETGVPVTITKDNMSCAIKVMEQDKYPDTYNKQYVLGKGINTFEFTMYEQYKVNPCKNKWAKWRVVIECEPINSIPSPSVNPSPSATTSPVITTVIPSPITSSIDSIVATEEKVLPKTGEDQDDSKGLIIAGCIILVVGIISVVINFIRRKRPSDN